MIRHLFSGSQAIKRTFLAWAICGSAFAQSWTVQSDHNGQYYLNGYLGSAPIRMLLDTGATKSAIPQFTANQAGDYGGQCQWERMRTGNGLVDYCNRVFTVLRIGPFEFRNFTASVHPDTAGVGGVLGMDLLRLMRIHIEGDRLTLSR